MSNILNDFNHSCTCEPGKECAKQHRKKKDHNKTCEMIPKPKGRPGRRNGYSIKDSMGLARQSNKYNAFCVSSFPKCSHGQRLTWLAIKDLIRKCVVQHLDTSCPLSRQKDKLMVEKLIVKASFINPMHICAGNRVFLLQVSGILVFLIRIFLS